MKLHLPLGLLVAVLASFQVNAEPPKPKTFDLTFSTAAEWEYDADASLYRCHLPFALYGSTGVWSIRTTFRRSQTELYLSTLPERDAALTTFSPDFRLEASRSNFKHIGMGDTTDVPLDNTTDRGASWECVWSNKEGTMTVDLIEHRPTSSLGDQNHGPGSTVGVLWVNREEPIRDLWASQVWNVSVSATMELEASGEYVVARSGVALGSYAGGGTGLLAVWEDTENPLTRPVLNGDEGGNAEGLFLDSELDAGDRKALRFVPKGRTTIKAKEDSRYQSATVGDGGVVYTGGDFYAKSITVDERATGYTLNVNGSATLGDGKNATLRFEEDFTLTGTGVLAWDANVVTFEITEGKTVYLNMGGELAGGGGSVEVGAKDVDGERVVGGTLSVGGDYALGGGRVAVYGSTLDMNGTEWQNKLTLYSIEETASVLLRAENAAEGTEVRVVAQRAAQTETDGETGDTPGTGGDAGDDGVLVPQDLYVEFNLGGLKGDYLKSVVFNNEVGESDSEDKGSVGGRVYGIGGGTVRVGEREVFKFLVEERNIDVVGKRDEAPTSGTYLMEFSKSGAVEFDDEGKVEFLLSDDVCEYLNGLDDEGGFVDIWFTNGELTELAKLQEFGLGAVQNWIEQHFEFEVGVDVAYVPLGPEDFMGGTATGGGGVLRFMIHTDGVWIATVHDDAYADDISDERWKQVRVNDDMTVKYADTGDSEIILRNLNSGSDGSGNLTIVNTTGEAADKDGITLVIDQQGEENENVVSRTLRGSIILDKGEAAKRINLTKKGTEELKVTGNVENVGTLTVEAGQFTIGGKLVGGGTLNVSETKDAAEGEEVIQNKLVLNGDGGDVEHLGTIGHGSVVEVNGILTLKGDSTPQGEGGKLGGKLAGKGAIVTEGALDASNVLLEGVGVELRGAKASLVTATQEVIEGIAGAEGRNRISALLGEGTEEGSGSVTLGGDLTIDSTDSRFQGAAAFYRGSISASGEDAKTLTVAGAGTDQTLCSVGDSRVNLTVDGGAHLSLRGETANVVPAAAQSEVLSAGTTYGNVTVKGSKEEGKTGSTLTVIAPGEGYVNTQLTTETLTVEAGGTLEVYYNLKPTEGDMTAETGKRPGAAVESGSVTWEEGAKLVLGSLGINLYDLLNPQDLKDLEILRSESGGIEGLAQGQLQEGKDYELEGSFRVFWTNMEVVCKDGKIVVNADARKGNIFAEDAEKDENVQAGAQLLWEARTCAAMNTPGSVFRQVMNQLANDLVNAQTVSKTFAGVAGSTVPIAGTAQRDALRAQMLRMRDHAGAMGLDGDFSYGSLPYTHFWLEASGDFANLNDDGMMSGYKYNSWGGTVGVGMDLSERTSLGLGLSALYGDLDGGSCDKADGNMDSYYLSLMARFTRRRWGHTLVGVVGLNSVDLDRTVQYGAGSYTTHGSTDGWGAGLMYELTYDIPLNEEHTRVLQPLLGASVMRTTLDGYSESGQGVGLDVGEQEWVTSTFMLGLRWISAVGASAFNTAAQLELRANIAQDVGDSQGSADVALQVNPGVRREVKAAEVGKTAAQLGAALRVPLSEESLLYFNVGADLRSGMDAWNVTAGLKYNF